MLKVTEFAERAGVTVRTLHYYDRLGLLRPSSRTRAGYRLYGERELAHLQQIVTLKFLGLPLKDIKRLLDRSDLNLAQTLSLQRRLLGEKRRQLDVAMQAIAEAERSASQGRTPDWAALKKIIEVMEMQNNNQWTRKYYSEEAQAKVSSRAHIWTPELQAKVSEDWQDLVREVEAAMEAGEAPSGVEGPSSSPTLDSAGARLYRRRSRNPKRPEQDVGRSKKLARKSAQVLQR